MGGWNELCLTNQTKLVLFYIPFYCVLEEWSSVLPSVKPSWFPSLGTVQFAMLCCAALCVQVELCPVTAACKVQVTVSFNVIISDLHPGVSGSSTQVLEGASSSLGNICWYVTAWTPGRSLNLTLCQAYCICCRGGSCPSILAKRLPQMCTIIPAICSDCSQQLPPFLPY